MHKNKKAIVKEEKNSMKKRILGIIVCILMVMTLLPNVALAAPDTTGIDVSEATADASGDGWTWNNADKVLTLFGVDISVDIYEGYAIYLPDGATVELVGYNKVEKAADWGASICCNDKLTIKGSGILEVSATGTHSFAIEAETLNLSGGYIKASAVNAAIYSENDLTVSGGYIEATGTKAGLMTKKGEYIQTGGYVKAKANNAVRGLKGIEVSGGYLEAVGENCGCQTEGSECFVTNSGGVIKASASASTGAGISGDYNGDTNLTVSGGVTIVSGGAKAINGKITTTNGEKGFDIDGGILMPEGYVYTDGTTGSESIVIAKAAYSTAQTELTTLDGVYVKAAAGAAVTCSGEVAVTGGSYAENNNFAGGNGFKLEAGATTTAAGGTLVGIGSSVSSINAAGEYPSGIQLIGIGTGETFLGNTAVQFTGNTAINEANVIGVASGDSFGIFYIMDCDQSFNGSLIGVCNAGSNGIGFYRDPDNHTSKFSVTGGSMTGYTKGDSGINLYYEGNAENFTGSNTISGGSISAATMSDRNAIGGNISNKTSITGSTVGAYSKNGVAVNNDITVPDYMTAQYAAALSGEFGSTRDGDSHVAYIYESPSPSPSLSPAAPREVQTFGVPTMTDPVSNQSVTVAVGGTGRLSVVASDALSYQWQIDRGQGWKDISGATGSVYTTSEVTADNNGYKYRCIITNDSGRIASPVFTLAVESTGEATIGTAIDIPQTGDTSGSAFWVGIGMMSLLVLGAAYYGLCRRKEHN